MIPSRLLFVSANLPSKWISPGSIGKSKKALLASNKTENLVNLREHRPHQLIPKLEPTPKFASNYVQTIEKKLFANDPTIGLNLEDRARLRDWFCTPDSVKISDRKSKLKSVVKKHLQTAKQDDVEYIEPYKAPKMMSLHSERRQERLQEFIQARVMQMLGGNLAAHIPELSITNWSITSVDVSPDLRSAIIYWQTIYDEKNKDSIEKRLHQVGKQIQYRLSEELRYMRYPPRIQFQFDRAGKELDETLNREIEK